MGRVLFSKHTLEAFQELLWPTRCAFCDELGELLCPDCMQMLSWIEQRYACPVCGAPCGWLVCTECKEAWETEAVVSAFTYEGPAASLITVYKDQNEVRLAPYLAAALVGALEEASFWERKEEQLCAFLGKERKKRTKRVDFSAIDAVTFIPATHEAYRRRGFDHMELVANKAAEMLELPLVDVLIHEEAKDQRKLGREDRVKNMKGTFEVAKDVYGARLLLLDDVITTGASIREAARALLVRGASAITAASVARTW